MKQRAFSLIEVMVAAFILAVAVLSVMMVSQYSNRGSMDAYYEFMALTLAKEPVEIFRALGYDWLAKHAENPHPEYPLGEAEIAGDGIKRPVEASAFMRKIEMKISPAEKAAHLTVTVFPVGQSRAQAWLSRKSVTIETLIIGDKP